jgi:hypothetical protein
LQHALYEKQRVAIPELPDERRDKTTPNLILQLELVFADVK